MTDATIFAGGGFEVTALLLRTPRKTYAIERIEYVSVERPLLLFATPPAIALLGFGAAFHRYLYAGEITALVIGCAGVIALALRLGTLRVHSLALRDEEVASSFGLISTLRQVRRAVETAMAERHGGVDPS